MEKKTRSTDRLWIATLATGLALPTLSLIPLGSIWLWQHGYLLAWALAVMICVLIAALAQRRYLAKPPNQPTEPNVDERADKSWTPVEQEAWRAVESLARNVDTEALTSQEAILELGAETIRAVAHKLHPEVKDPLWQFTVPEAFALLERVSRRLHRFTVDNVPLGDRLTVANALAIYRWRSALDVAEKAYDIWRLARLVNPATAATHELRERLSRQMLQFGRAQVTDRLVDAYVKEIGRAAIDLYGGRLRISPAVLEEAVTSSSIMDADAIASRSSEPLRILVTGTKGVGKSSLIAAMAGELHAAVDPLHSKSGFVPYRLRRHGFPLALLINSPAFDDTDVAADAIVKKVVDCDLLICVVDADRADRNAERRLLAKLQAVFGAMPRRKPPPVVFALTHIDLLRPVRDWNPPYDIASPTSPKASAIRAALEDVVADLSFPSDAVVPISLRQANTYNVDAIWDLVALKLPDAQRAKLVRQLSELKPGWNIRKIWSQAVGAGRVLGRSMQRHRK